MTNIGKLFVFEGGDNVGKTTISQLVEKKLNGMGLPVSLMSFPGKEEGTLGNLVYGLHHEPETKGVRSLTPTSLQVLHIAAHIDAIENKIIPILLKGDNVLLDRYWWSTFVYGKIGGVKLHSLKSMIFLEKQQWANVKPDIIFLINRSKLPENEFDIKNWLRIQREYRNLARREAKLHHVCEINNDSDVNSAIDQIINKIDLVLSTEKNNQRKIGLQIYSSLAPAKPTKVYDSYWEFAAERQAVFFRKLSNFKPPLTKDPILSKYKFTNVYRASDRVSQYLIRNVIYKGDQSVEEIFFRIILFKTFNSIKTWERLENKFGEISYKEFSFKLYDKILTEIRKTGNPIYSSAYIMTSGNTAFGFNNKHQNHLKLVEKLMEDSIPQKIISKNNMKQVFELLRSYPTIGNFLAYQYSIDINYSELTNFSENEFVFPGPGSKDGLHKCFSDLGGLSEIDIIKLTNDRQEMEFETRGLKFRNLWGRAIKLIDSQNLFCEVDKYSRIAHPEIIGSSSRKKIKHKYLPNPIQISFWYPPKWNINHLIKLG